MSNFSINNKYEVSRKTKHWNKKISSMSTLSPKMFEEGFFGHYIKFRKNLIHTFHKMFVFWNSLGPEMSNLPYFEQNMNFPKKLLLPTFDTCCHQVQFRKTKCFYMLFSSPLVNFASFLMGQPHSLDVNHSFSSIFKPNVLGSLVTRMAL